LDLALKSDDTEEMVETKLRAAIKSAEEIVTVWRLRIDTATSVVALVVRVQRLVVRSIEKNASTSKLSIADASKEEAPKKRIELDATHAEHRLRSSSSGWVILHSCKSGFH
jgi:hypothetical protein